MITNTKNTITNINHLLSNFLCLLSMVNATIKSTQLHSPPKPRLHLTISFLKSQAHSLNLQTQTLHFTPKKNKPILLLSWLGSKLQPFLPFSPLQLPCHLHPCQAIQMVPPSFLYHPIF